MATKKPKTGGRTKGTPNKRTEEMRQLLEDIVADEYGERRTIPELLAIIGIREMHKDPEIANMALAEKSLNDAAAYGYAKLKAIEHSGAIATPPSVNVYLAD